MKKIAISLALCLLVGTSVGAQENTKKIKLDGAILTDSVSDSDGLETVRSIFRTIPNNIIFGLADDHIDRLLTKSTDTTVLVLPNVFGGEMKRLALSDNFIALQTSETGTTQIKLLSLVNESKIICVVKTVCGGICDSQVRFYTSKWKPIPERELLPDLNLEWFIKDEVDKQSQEYKNALAAIDIYPMKVALHPGDSNLSVDFSIKSYLSREESKNILPLLKDEPKVLIWDQVRFK